MNQSPFAWLVVTPLVTAPLSAVLLFAFGDALDATALGLPLWRNESIPASVYYFDFWPTLLLLTTPGLLNLLVAPWLFRDLTYERMAGALALTLALLRTFVVPLAAIIWFSASVVGDAGLLIRVPINEGGGYAPSTLTATFRLLTTAWTSGLWMWLVTVGLWLAYEPLMERFLPNVMPPHDRHPDEATRWGEFLGRRR